MLLIGIKTMMESTQMHDSAVGVPDPDFATMGMGGSHSTFQLSIDFLAVFIGLFAIVMVIKLNHKLGGRIHRALRYFILGVLSNVLAIVWSLSFGHLYTIGGFSLDMHQNLMTIGMVFFIISTVRFSKLVQNV